MVLQLGEGHTEFYGTNKGQMPLLVKAGLVPMSVAQLMQRRVAVLGDEALKGAFWDHYFDTGDAVAYKDDKVKVVLDAAALREMNARSELSNGALILPDGVYEALEGPEFTREELTRLGIDKALSQTQVREHPVWQALARDQAVLDEYVSVIFREAKTRYNYNENMGLYVAAAQKQPTMRAWCVNLLHYRSYAYGLSFLNDDNGRLVGVAPEARVGAERQTPQKLEAPLSVEGSAVVAPTLDQIMARLRPYVAPALVETVQGELATLYTKK